jgi:hypothetical protein
MARRKMMDGAARPCWLPAVKASWRQPAPEGGRAGQAAGQRRARGASTGLAGGRIYARRRGLSAGAVALDTLIFAFWRQPPGVVALLIAILLPIVLEPIGLPPSVPAAADPALRV